MCCHLLHSSLRLLHAFGGIYKLDAVLRSTEPAIQRSPVQHGSTTMENALTLEANSAEPTEMLSPQQRAKHPAFLFSTQVNKQERATTQMLSQKMAPGS